MTKPNTANINNVITVQGNTLVLKVGEYRLTLNIEGPEPKMVGRFQTENGKNMFDLVLEAARHHNGGLFQGMPFTAAHLYHIALELHPELEIRRNSWNSHVMSSAPDHPSYRHYTSHRDYFKYHGGGKYSLEPKWSADKGPNES
jgi:hypothetical protein